MASELTGSRLCRITERGLGRVAEPRRGTAGPAEGDNLPSLFVGPVRVRPFVLYLSSRIPCSLPLSPTRAWQGKSSDKFSFSRLRPRDELFPSFLSDFVPTSRREGDARRARAIPQASRASPGRKSNTDRTSEGEGMLLYVSKLVSSEGGGGPKTLRSSS